jgi:hypothetical protein
MASICLVLIEEYEAIEVLEVDKLDKSLLRGSVEELNVLLVESGIEDV